MTITTRPEESVPDFPRITARFSPDGTVELDMLGHTTHYDNQDTARAQALAHVRDVARDHVRRPVRLLTYSAAGDFAPLIITPDGTYFHEHDQDVAGSVDALLDEGDLGDDGSTADTEPADAAIDDDAAAPSEAGLSALSQMLDNGGAPAQTGPPTAEDQAAVTPAPEAEPTVETQPDATASPTATPPAAPTASPVRPRGSFIRSEQAVRPARHGWRGALNRAGLRLGPGRAEQAERADIDAVCHHWPGPRTVAVANPKGSASKTPTTVMLSAVFARYGGAGVLAWDNNETRGSLGWRTQQAGHDATVLTLLPRTDELLSPTAQAAELSRYTHHQPADKYDVLQSDQSVAGGHVVSAGDVDDVHRVGSRYYRLMVMDSGNNERADNWRSMIERAHALVVPCTNVEDTAEAGALMLEALASRGDHCAGLARDAVAIVSQRTPGKDPNMARIVAGMRPLVREVVEIPFDPALVSGVIHYDALQPRTQRAWLRAAAAVAGGLAGSPERR